MKIVTLRLEVDADTAKDAAEAVRDIIVDRVKDLTFEVVDGDDVETVTIPA